MSNAQPQLISQMFGFAMQQTLTVVEALPAGIRLKPFAPGKAHAHWLLGHMAYALNMAGLRFTFGAPFALTDDWIRWFGPDFRGGQGPVTDPAAIPDWTTVIEGYKTSIAALRAQVETLNDADLPGPMRGPVPATPPPPPHYTAVGSALTFLIQHDAYHRGQLGILRAMG